MKQVVQTLGDGKLRVEEVPYPSLRAGGALVQTAWSVISAGTERQKAETGSKSLLGKALARPDQVRKVIDTARAQGISATWRRVRRELDQPRPLGYSAAGTILALGDGGDGLRPGMRVAIGGGGYANHAEINFVPRRLIVPVPSGVDLADAAFACVGSVALHGVRQADLRLGETAVVIGLGMVGLMTVQLLAASGVRVVAIDLSEARCRLAAGLGAAHAYPRHADALESMVATATNGVGADAALLCADTPSDDPISLGARLSRDRGRVVVVGNVGLGISRATFYNREIDLRFSRSYGPGRYDPSFEEEGHDYPLGYVRWTEERNMAAFLDLVAAGKVTPSRLVTHRFGVADAEDAYATLTDRTKGAIGVLLEYDAGDKARRDIDRSDVFDADELARQDRPLGGAAPTAVGGTANAASLIRPVRIGWIGPGKFAQAMLLPHLPRETTEMIAGAGASGLSSREIVRKWRFSEALGDATKVIRHPEVDLVMITTRHDQHGPLVIEALRAGKVVFAEKPLCLTTTELEEIAMLLTRRGETPDAAGAAEDETQTAPNATPPSVAAGAAGLATTAAAVLRDVTRRPVQTGRLMVGFNRRFAPATRAVLDCLAAEAAGVPRHVGMTILAGQLPEDSWIHRSEGGGRILGEVCHFVDLALCLAGAPAATIYARPLASKRWENLSVLIQHSDGSLSQITYLAVGGSGLPKERIEVSAGAMTAQIDDFRTTTLTVDRKSRTLKHGTGDKGHAAEMRALIESVARGQWSASRGASGVAPGGIARAGAGGGVGPRAEMPISAAEILHSTAATFAVLESMKSGEPIDLESPR
jgi:predicted dehydrogenase